MEIVSTLADCLAAIGHPSRLDIVKYCLKPNSKFADLTKDLRLNPATFRFHAKVLMKCGLIEKVKRGRYETTKLGNLVLELVEQANEIAKEKLA